MLCNYVPLIQANETFEAIGRLAGSAWATAIVQPDKLESVITRYSRSGNTIAGKGIARSFGKDAIQTSSSFTLRTDGTVRQEDQQGDMHLAGTARFEDGRLVFTYGQAGGDEAFVRDELTFVDVDTAKGVVRFKDGTQIATYTMRRIKAPAPKVVLSGRDPILLAKGKEIDGKDGLAATYGPWTYRFANQQNLDRFKSNPERHGVQFGGACMYMGPLSGRGQPNLYQAHKGSLYLFASLGCRSRFAKAPDSFIDRPEAPPRASKGEQARAAILLDSAAKAHGTVDQISSMSWYRLSFYEDGGKKLPLYEGMAADVQGRAADSTAYADQLFRSVADGKSSWQGSVAAPTIMTQDEAEYVHRNALKNPVWFVRHRKQPGFVAAPIGRQQVDGVDCDGVRANYRGLTLDVFIDMKSKLIHSIGFKGRTARGYVPVEHRFTDYREVGGVKVPFGWTAISAGKSSVTQLEKVTINSAVDKGLFANPLSL